MFKLRRAPSSVCPHGSTFPRTPLSLPTRRLFWFELYRTRQCCAYCCSRLPQQTSQQPKTPTASKAVLFLETSKLKSRCGVEVLYTMLFLYFTCNIKQLCESKMSKAIHTTFGEFFILFPGQQVSRMTFQPQQESSTRAKGSQLQRKTDRLQKHSFTADRKRQRLGAQVGLKTQINALTYHWFLWCWGRSCGVYASGSAVPDNRMSSCGKSVKRHTHFSHGNIDRDASFSNQVILGRHRSPISATSWSDNDRPIFISASNIDFLTNSRFINSVLPYRPNSIHITTQ